MGDDSDSSEEFYFNNRPKRSYNPNPHRVTIVKAESGFGFNVKGQVSEGGQLKSIHGNLYPPLQHVSAVLRGGAAEKAGLLRGDRILAVNNKSVEGSNHKTVVDFIKAGGDKLDLVVLSVDLDEIDPPDTSYADETMYNYKYDYSEKRSLPITIPSYRNVNVNGEKFVAYNVHMAGRHLGSRRYSEFVTLNKVLKEEYSDFEFPKLPTKWPFKMNHQQLDTRRRGLEQYLEKICSVKVIADSEIMQEFLMEDTNASYPVNDVTLRILLPDGKCLALDVKRNASSATVFHETVRALQISNDAKPYLALFEMIDPSFERKLQSEEPPHTIYIQNYSSAASSCIVLRKWCFDLDAEKRVCSTDPQFKRICFHQAVTDLNDGRLTVPEKLYQLKALQSEEKMDQYLKAVRKLDGYGRVNFPECRFECGDDRGYATISLDFSGVFIKLVKEESKKEKQFNLTWDLVTSYHTRDAKSPG
uniref:Sorting nexin-27 n=1 Tax=Panagrellus redivivus TaxID=6233 RepID=A0A7E4UPL1_PANRE